MAETDDLNRAADQRSTQELHDDIAAHRESISQIVTRIENKVRGTMDWKKYLAEYPYAVVGVAVGTGFLASMLLKKRSTQRLAGALMANMERFVDNLRRLA